MDSTEELINNENPFAKIDKSMFVVYIFCFLVYTLVQFVVRLFCKTDLSTLSIKSLQKIKCHKVNRI